MKYLCENGTIFVSFLFFTLIENQKFEYRSVIKFLVLEGESPSNIYKLMVVAYGDHAPSRTTVFEWARRLKDRHKIILDVVDQLLQQTIKLLKMLKV